MSPIGRIFVVINLVLAALFLGSAAANLASAQKYRSVAETVVIDAEATKTTLDAEIASLVTEKLDMERLRTQAKNEKDVLETQKVALDQDIARKTDELNELKSDMGKFSSSVSDMATQLENQSSQVEQANNDRLAAVEGRRDAEDARMEAVESQAAAEDQVNDLTAQVAQLRADLTSTRSELQSTETLLEVAMATTGLTADDLGDAAPSIEGAVLQVASDVKPGLVHINRGSADMVKAGYVFDIYSSGVYKGQARVEIVNANSCTARIMTAVDGTTIVQGDTASTRI